MKIILPTSFLIIAALIFFLVTNPIFGEIKQLKDEVTVYNLALNNSTELQETRDSLVDVYKNIKKEDKDRLNHFLPRTVSNIELILEIEKIANSYGMPIRNIKFESKNVANVDKENTVSDNSNMVVAEVDPDSYLPYGIFPIEFVIEGKYENFKLFLNELEQNLRLVDVKSISFTIPEKSTKIEDKIDPSIYSYNLKIETYWLK